MAYNSIIDRNDAAALIPEPVANEIIQGMVTQSVALSLMRRVRMSSKQTRMPVLSALPQAYFVSGDTGLKQTTEQAWANKYLVAEELAVIVPIPEAVLDDAEFDMWAEIRPRLEEAIGVALDAAVLFGVNKPEGWTAPSIVEGADAAGNEVIRGAINTQDLSVDISDTMALVEADGFDVNGFAARKTFKAGLRGLRDENGGLLFQPSLTAGTPDTLYGERLKYIANDAWQANLADLIAGDWNQAILAVRQDFTYKMLTEAVITDTAGNIIYNLAQQDMVALRVVFRCAYQVANAINRMNANNNTRFPFAVMRPAGFVG